MELPDVAFAGLSLCPVELLFDSTLDTKKVKARGSQKAESRREDSVVRDKAEQGAAFLRNGGGIRRS